MSEIAATPAPRSDAPQSMNRASALFIALLVTVGLSALAFWPRTTWTPPRRPTLQAPIVFDEFVNPPPPSAISSAPDPATH
jgi:hypothetical protein